VVVPQGREKPRAVRWEPQVSEDVFSRGRTLASSPLVERALEVELTDHLGGSSSSAAFRERCVRAEELTEDVAAAIEASAAA